MSTLDELPHEILAGLTFAQRRWFLAAAKGYTWREVPGECRRVFIAQRLVVQARNDSWVLSERGDQLLKRMLGKKPKPVLEHRQTPVFKTGETENE